MNAPWFTALVAARLAPRGRAKIVNRWRRRRWVAVAAGLAPPSRENAIHLHSHLGARAHTGIRLLALRSRVLFDRCIIGKSRLV